MNEVTPTAAERAAERFGDAALQRAVSALQADGYVVIDDVIDHSHLDRLQERMSEDLVKIRALPVVPHNFVWGNIQQTPPPDAGLVFRDVMANPFVCQVTCAVLGRGAFNNTLTGNTNVPGSGLQPVHVDDGQLWPNLRRGASAGAAGGERPAERNHGGERRHRAVAGHARRHAHGDRQQHPGAGGAC